MTATYSRAAAPMGRRSEVHARIGRVGAMSGVLAVILWVTAGVMLDRNEANVLGDSNTAGAAQIAAYLQGESTTIYLGTILFGLGAVAFLWFLAILRERLASSPGGLATWAFASGGVAVATTFGFFALRLGATMALDTRPGGISDQAVEALYVGMDGYFVMTWFALGSFYLATGLASLRLKALPTWLGWATVALGVISLLIWIAWISEFLLPLWVALVTAYLIRDDAPGRTTDPVTAEPHILDRRSQPVSSNAAPDGPPNPGAAHRRCSPCRRS